MKALTSISLALVLAFGAASASAGGKHKHHKKNHSDWQVSVHHNHYGGHKYRKHHRRHYSYDYRYRYRPHDYYGHRGGYWRYRRHGDYYPYLGAAIAGSIIGHSFYHLHDNNVCYDNHDRRGDRYRGYTEVVGCHRIEQLPDGRERRVDVPLSQCN